MKLPKIRENSLFAVLLRSPWWVSLLIAAGVFALARLWLPVAYALAVPLPFFVIGVLAAVRQARTPSPRMVEEALAALRAGSWADLAAALERMFRAQGYEVAVARARSGAADLELTRQGYLTLASGRRWKAARLGIEPLRELHAEADAREARECLCIALGEISAAALKYAAENRVRLIAGAELVALLRASGWRPAPAPKSPMAT